MPFSNYFLSCYHDSEYMKKKINFKIVLFSLGYKLIVISMYAKMITVLKCLGVY